jgi:hypothetical protein
MRIRLTHKRIEEYCVGSENEASEVAPDVGFHFSGSMVLLWIEDVAVPGRKGVDGIKVPEPRILLS